MPAAEAAAILLLFLKDPSMWNLPQQKKPFLFSPFSPRLCGKPRCRKRRERVRDIKGVDKASSALTSSSPSFGVNQKVFLRREEEKFFFSPVFFSPSSFVSSATTLFPPSHTHAFPRALHFVYVLPKKKFFRSSSLLLLQHFYREEGGKGLRCGFSRNVGVRVGASFYPVTDGGQLISLRKVCARKVSFS